jgi:cation diffusion facilitator family transporter
MNIFYDSPFGSAHEHVFLGTGHTKNERKVWAVIALCSAMMLVEIIGGKWFGSLALIADGLHMSTHAGAMLIAALAYTYARKHASDRRFVFGTGKLGDLAGFTSAMILIMIALLIGYEAVSRFLNPVPIRFREAIPIAAVGLLVNIASAWLLSEGEHGHDHGHSHGHHHHGHDDHEDEVRHIATESGMASLSIFEEGVPPVFRLAFSGKLSALDTSVVTVTTVRSDGARQTFSFVERDGFLESTSDIPEPHDFKVEVSLGGQRHDVVFEEHHHDDHGPDSRDHNIRAAYLHVIADAAVSVLVIIGLLLAKAFGWMWLDPLAGMIGAVVIANWSYGLIRQTGAILLDASSDQRTEHKISSAVEAIGDRIVDIHVWRLGPGHLGAIVSVVTHDPARTASFYHGLLRELKGLSHLTVEVHSAPSAGAL